MRLTFPYAQRDLWTPCKGVPKNFVKYQKSTFDAFIA